MARRQYSTVHHETEVDLIPLMDLALNLTFFFVVLTTLAQDQAMQGINLPLTEAASVAEEAAIPDSISINLTASAHVLSWGEDLDLYSPNDEERLVTLVRNEAARARNQSDDNQIRTTVILRIDENADYRDFQKVVDICQAEGFYKFVLKSRMEEL